jgi:hypothetical protein
MQDVDLILSPTGDVTPSTRLLHRRIKSNISNDSGDLNVEAWRMSPLQEHGKEGQEETKENTHTEQEGEESSAAEEGAVGARPKHRRGRTPLGQLAHPSIHSFTHPLFTHSYIFIISPCVLPLTSPLTTPLFVAIGLAVCVCVCVCVCRQHLPPRANERRKPEARGEGAKNERCAARERGQDKAPRHWAQGELLHHDRRGGQQQRRHWGHTVELGKARPRRWRRRRRRRRRRSRLFRGCGEAGEV